MHLVLEKAFSCVQNIFILCLLFAILVSCYFHQYIINDDAFLVLSLYIQQIRSFEIQAFFVMMVTLSIVGLSYF